MYLQHHQHTYTFYSAHINTQTLNDTFKADTFFGAHAEKLEHKCSSYESAEKFIISPFFALFCSAPRARARMVFSWFWRRWSASHWHKKRNVSFCPVAYILCGIDVDEGDMNFFNKIARNRVKNIITHTHTNVNDTKLS